MVPVNGIDMSYTDFGGAGRPLLALHGTFGRGSVFTRLARDLAGQARVIAPDLRGHGNSDRASHYGTEDLVADIVALLRHLGLKQVVVLGHSRGGVAAYQLAARHPELVSALIIEDIGPLVRSPEIAHPVLDVRGWPATAPTKAALAAAIRKQGVPDPSYFMLSAVAAPDGSWTLLFDWDDMMAVQTSGVGDWWPDWLGSACPALVLRGEHSPLLPSRLAAEMVSRRPASRLITFPGAGHWIHDDKPEAMAATVAGFLRELGDDPAQTGSTSSSSNTSASAAKTQRIRTAASHSRPSRSTRQFPDASYRTNPALRRYGLE